MDEMTAAAEQIWQQEVAYWNYLQAGDFEGYMTLWHEDVAAWPNNSNIPHGKRGVRRHMEGLLSAIDLETIRLDLKPVAVIPFGDALGVVHYELHLHAEASGADVEVHERLTHTWRRGAHGWQIIAGMSAPLANP